MVNQFPQSVIKRSGETELFELDKIKNAIRLCLTSCDVPAEKTPEYIESVISVIQDHLQGETEVHVERVQDLAEEALMSLGLHAEAKHYILYRERHRQAREALEAVDDTLSPHVPFVRSLVRELLERARNLSRDLGEDPEILDVLDYQGLTQQVVRQSYADIGEYQVWELLVLTTRSKIEWDLRYETLARCLLLNQIEDVVGLYSARGSETDVLSENYGRGVDGGRYDRRLVDGRFDFDKLNAAIAQERDSLFTYEGLQDLMDRYLRREFDGRLLETPQSFYMRVAMGLALEEDDPTARAIEFYDVLSQHLYSPSTPTLFNGGTVHMQLASCFLLTISDSLNSIFQGVTDSARLSKWAGGLGTDLTQIRSAGSLVKGTGGKSKGPIPFMKVYNSQSVAVTQGEIRKGAATMWLGVWHRDIQAFLDARLRQGDERMRCHDIHLGVWIDDLFMERVEADANWTLFCPSETPDLHDLYGDDFRRRYSEYEAQAEAGEIENFKVVRALDLYRLILTRSYQGGEPFIGFKDAANLRNPQAHDGVIHSSNLCCVRGDQRAVTNLGMLTAAELADYDDSLKVSARNGSTESATPMVKTLTDVPLFEVTTAGGYSHVVTADHPLWVPGSGWCETQYLTKGTAVELQAGVGLFYDEEDYVQTDLRAKMEFACNDLHWGWEDMLDGEEDEPIPLVVPDIIWRVSKTNVLRYLREVYRVCSQPYELPSVKAARNFTFNRLRQLGGLSRDALPTTPPVTEVSSDTLLPPTEPEPAPEPEAQSQLLSVEDRRKRSKAVAMFLGETESVEDNEDYAQYEWPIQVGTRYLQFLKDLQILWMNLGVRTRLSVEDGVATLAVPTEHGKWFVSELMKELEVPYSEDADEDTDYDPVNDPTTLEGPELEDDEYVDLVQSVVRVDDGDAYCLQVQSEDRAWICNGFVTKNTEITLNTSSTKLKAEILNEDGTYTREYEAGDVGVCVLGSVNLPAHLMTNADGQQVLDFPLMARTVTTAIRMLDNVIDLGFYPTPEARISCMKHRAVALGQMGFQDVLWAMGIKYESEAAVELASTISEWISVNAVKASAELARQRGKYATYEGSTWDQGLMPHETLAKLQASRQEAVDVPPDFENFRSEWVVARHMVEKYGVRNSNLMAIAPTASISRLVGVRQGIDPQYWHVYAKVAMGGEFTSVSASLVRELQARGLWTRELLDQIKDSKPGSTDELNIPQDLKELYATAFDIDPSWLIKCAAARQRWIDQGQSLNLYMRYPTGKMVADAYFQAWRAGLKTVYYLRSLGSNTAEKSTVAKRQSLLQTSTPAEPRLAYAEPRPQEEVEVLMSCDPNNPDCEACQ